MPTFRRYTVSPSLPAPLEKLREIANNLWWSWAPEAHELFVRMDRDLWEEVYGNPIELIARVGQARLEALSADDAFVNHLNRAHASLTEYMSEKGWFLKSFPTKEGAKIAYFSMEYGLHESLPIYSGGLGVLAGDHLKTASDIGLPLVGIGLAYAEGYFRQHLSEDGWQLEHYPLNDWHRLPVQPVWNPANPKERLTIHVRYPHGMVDAQLWKVQVGRVPLYLLDTNLEQNAPSDRSITGPLYGGDQEFRIRQEVMLGIGGIHALEALGISATVCHMNEGHSAFLALERIRRVMESKKVSFQVAREACSAGNVFTTHTPVPAGNDAFHPDNVRRFLGVYREPLGLSDQDFLALGRQNGAGDPTPFSMPILAMRTADRYNGVSALHGDVSRKMWRDLWPDMPTSEVPIGSVTNGVHVPSWVSDDMSALYTRYLGAEWRERTDDVALWARVHDIPDAELWSTHGHRRHRLVALCRKRLRLAAERRGANKAELALADEALDPRALTIGFARRFATYKRATLLFSDIERVKKLLGDPERPVQLVFAGKAHPQDKGGKELIRAIVRLGREADFRGKVVFIENYDMRVARALVSGVDVWLNTPRRPHEASGTSGMKAAANGALNLSILDGWWAEAWAKFGSPVGWAIGNGEDAVDDAGDRMEAEALYDILEREVVPLFFDRGGDRLPRGWVQKMKATIAHCVPEFNTARMVKEYTGRFYVPSIDKTGDMMRSDLAGAKDLAAWKDRVGAAWNDVAIRDVKVDHTELVVGEAMRVHAEVSLGAITPGDVVVEVYHGPTAGAYDLAEGTATPMKLHASRDGVHTFVGDVPTKESGTHAFAVRVVPYRETQSHKFETGLIRWA